MNVKRYFNPGVLCTWLEYRSQWVRYGVGYCAHRGPMLWLAQPYSNCVVQLN